MISAYQLRCLPDMGIDIRNLGCVMLDVKPLNLEGVLDPEWAYTSEVMPHVTGIQKEWHLTLKFGLMSNAHRIRNAVDEVLEGWRKPENVLIEGLTVFDSPMASEPYGCVVAKVQIDTDLMEAHTRLSLLPHIDTFPVWQPHVTLAYIKTEFVQRALEVLNQGRPDSLIALDLNYGKLPEVQA